MKLASYLAAGVTPPETIADFYQQAADGSWELQIDDTRPQTTNSQMADPQMADPQTTSSQTTNPHITAVKSEVNQDHQPSVTGAAMGGSNADAPQMVVSPPPVPAVAPKPTPIAEISKSGGGAGSLTETAPTSIGAHDSDAINQNLAALATGRITLSSH